MAKDLTVLTIEDLDNYWNFVTANHYVAAIDYACREYGRRVRLHKCHKLWLDVDRPEPDASKVVAGAGDYTKPYEVVQVDHDVRDDLSNYMRDVDEIKRFYLGRWNDDANDYTMNFDHRHYRVGLTASLARVYLNPEIQGRLSHIKVMRNQLHMQALRAYCDSIADDVYETMAEQALGDQKSSGLSVSKYRQLLSFDKRYAPLLMRRDLNAFDVRRDEDGEYINTADGEHYEMVVLLDAQRAHIAN